MTAPASSRAGATRGRDVAAPCRLLAGLLLLALVALSILQIFARTFLETPLTWTEELSRLLLVWMTFIGAAVVTYDGTHLKVDTFLIRLPPRVRPVVDQLNVIVALAFLATVMWFSLPILRLSSFGTTGALGVPFSAFRAPAPVGAALMLAFLLVRAVRGRRAPEMPLEEIPE